MVINGPALLQAAPIRDMLMGKYKEHGVSHGLTEVGYDIRLKQGITFYPRHQLGITCVPKPRYEIDGVLGKRRGSFCLASAIEEFQMPTDLVGIVHDKSTWARKGLSVFNTVIEPGWNGFLTLELKYNGQEELHLPAGCGIAQVIFHQISCPAQYEGKYQNQADEPVEAKHG